MPTKDLTISAIKAQAFGVVAFVIGAPLLFWPFYQIWGFSPKQLLPSGVVPILLFIVAMFIGIVVHELIHGLTAHWYGRIGWQHIKFGFDVKSGSPYCHATVPMTSGKYRVVVVMPLVILGLVPYAVSLLTGHVWLLSFGVFFTLAAVGDVMILWLMRHLPSDVLVQDHPTKVGLMVIRPEEPYS
ncbi:DUF3267 domain-containing protein [Spirosoma sp. SC4-14]|uniref:DUF3267 domain-containing protein n=1 Tax=Spirosoma sp. SC4-14 TaxID=3128900 RepID=UPI0030CE3804